jgi:tetratricopeptide (TPR) repeat protein
MHRLRKPFSTSGKPQVRSGLGGLPPHDIHPEAKQAASTAIELHEALADAGTALGFIKFFCDWDPRGAQEELNRALALHPHYPSAHHGQALSNGFLGRYNEAVNWIERALEIEPLSLILNPNKGYCFILGATMKTLSPS